MVTRMKEFTITLSNGATLTGLCNIPPPSSDITPNASKYRPLIVGLHGGSYSSLYFDVDKNHTASNASDALSVPFIAVNRPCYENSTSFYPIPENSSFPEQYGEWLHHFILPALWTEFGTPNCNCIVLHCHSLGASGAIIAAAKHAQEAGEARQYPLGGIVISGWGSQVLPPQPGRDFSVPAVRDAVMLPPGTAEAEVYEHTARLMRPIPDEEYTDIHDVWVPRWRTEWAPKVKVPLMLAVAERDLLWLGTDEHLRDWMAAFSGSVRVDGSFLRGAPHNIEMSLWSKAWYSRCFGFAIECAVSFGVAS